MRSTSAPPKYNHEDTMTIQNVEIIELVPVDQGTKLPLEGNEIDENKHNIDMLEPAVQQATLKDDIEQDDEEDSKRNVSNTNTLSSIICVVAGTGILAIAHALSQSGWIGLLYLIASACMSHFTGIILIKCLYAEKCHSGGGRLKDYADIGYAAFGKSGQVIGWVFSQAFLFLTPTIYMILASENISDILVQNGFIWLGRTACIWLIAIIIGVPFILVRNMKDVSFLSTFASLCTVCLLLVVCVVSMSSDYTEKIHTVHHDMAIPKNIPIAFSTFSFSYCGHVIYPHLEASMITPKRWSKVLLVSTCVISIMYFTMGLVCYLVFGDHVQSPVYKSLPVGSSQNIAMFVITIHVILVIPFYLYVFTTRIESWLKIEKQQENATSKIMRIALRIGQVAVCGIFAMFIPYFSDFMALVGTILSDTLSFVLPSIFWLKLHWYRSHKTDYEAIVCFIVAMVGVFCATFGTMDAAKQLYHDYVR